MPMQDATLGRLILGVSVIFFAYYFAWVVLLPFAEGDPTLTALFPAPRYALVVPAISGLLFLGGLSVFTLVALHRS